MRSTPWVRSLLFAAGLTACVSDARANDILVNGNFAQGKAHWEGDGKDAGGTSIDDISSSMSDQGAASGMVVNLKHGISYVSQVFHSGETTLTLSITYKTSADFAPTGDSSAGHSGGPPGMPQQGSFMDANGPITAILGFPVMGHLPVPGKDAAVALIADPSQNAVISVLFPLPTSPGTTHTSIVTFSRLMAHEDKTLYIFLPAGAGTVTFTSVTLAKPAPAASPDSPFQQ